MHHLHDQVATAYAGAGQITDSEADSTTVGFGFEFSVTGSVAFTWLEQWNAGACCIAGRHAARGRS